MNELNDSQKNIIRMHINELHNEHVLNTKNFNLAIDDIFDDAIEYFENVKCFENIHLINEKSILRCVSSIIYDLTH